MIDLGILLLLYEMYRPSSSKQTTFFDSRETLRYIKEELNGILSCSPNLHKRTDIEPSGTLTNRLEIEIAIEDFQYVQTDLTSSHNLKYCDWNFPIMQFRWSLLIYSCGVNFARNLQKNSNTPHYSLSFSTIICSFQISCIILISEFNWINVFRRTDVENLSPTSIHLTEALKLLLSTLNLVIVRF